MKLCCVAVAGTVGNLAPPRPNPMSIDPGYRGFCIRIAGVFFSDQPLPFACPHYYKDAANGDFCLQRQSIVSAAGQKGTDYFDVLMFSTTSISTGRLVGTNSRPS